MVFRPGQSGNPAGARKGVKRKPPPIVMRILKERNDTDPLLLLSTIVTTADAPLQLRAQCAIAMAPYLYPRVTARPITKPFDLPVVETVEDATAAIAKIGSLAARGVIGLDEASDLVKIQQAFIDAKVGMGIEAQLKVIEDTLARANIVPGITVSGGLGTPPGMEGVLMPAQLLGPIPRADDSNGGEGGGAGNGDGP